MAEKLNLLPDTDGATGVSGILLIKYKINNLKLLTQHLLCQPISMYILEKPDYDIKCFCNYPNQTIFIYFYF